MDKDTFLGLMLIASILMIPIIWVTTAKHLKAGGMGFIKRQASGVLASIIGSIGIFVAAAIYSEKLPESPEPVAVESESSESQQGAASDTENAEKPQEDGSESRASESNENETADSGNQKMGVLRTGAIYAVSVDDLNEGVSCNREISKITETEYSVEVMTNDETSQRYSKAFNKYKELKSTGRVMENAWSKDVFIVEDIKLFETSIKFRFNDSAKDYYTHHSNIISE